MRGGYPERGRGFFSRRCARRHFGCGWARPEVGGAWARYKSGAVGGPSLFGPGAGERRERRPEGNWGDRVGKSAAMREDRGSCGRFGVLGGAGEGLGSVGELGRCCKRCWGDFGSLHEGKLWPAGCFGVPDRFFVGLSR